MHRGVPVLWCLPVQQSRAFLNEPPVPRPPRQDKRKKHDPPPPPRRPTALAIGPSAGVLTSCDRVSGHPSSLMLQPCWRLTGAETHCVKLPPVLPPSLDCMPCFALTCPDRRRGLATRRCLATKTPSRGSTKRYSHPARKADRVSLGAADGAAGTLVRAAYCACQRPLASIKIGFL